MNELQENQQVADEICRDFESAGQQFSQGDWVALLDRQVVAVEKTLKEALAQLRFRAPDPDRGMLVRVEPEIDRDVLRRRVMKFMRKTRRRTEPNVAGIERARNL